MTAPTAPRATLHRFAPVIETMEGVVRFADAVLQPVLDLVIRAWLAQIFFMSGLLKTVNWQATVFLYTHEHPMPGLAPATAAALGTAIELICPVLLLFGLATRLAAVPLLLTTLFLQFTYVALDIHLYWMALLGLLIVRGPGRLSLDHAVAGHLEGSVLPAAGSLVRAADAITAWGSPVLLLAIRIWLAVTAVTGAAVATGDAATVVVTIACVLLAVGAGVRFAALVLAAAVLAGSVAAAMAETPWPPLLLLGTLILGGGGALSVDRLIRARLDRLVPSLSNDPSWLEGAPRVVIVGAGFGGVAAATALRHARARITLVDRRNYHLFQPLLYQVATATLSPADIATPIRALVRDQYNCRVIMGRVVGIDTGQRLVDIGHRQIPYDVLVLATGARHSYFGKDEWEPLAPGLKKIDDATAMRGRVLAAFESAETTDDPDERRRLLTFVIVGGGPTGVELAGAIAELARHGLKGEFRSCDPAEARVILVQSAPRLLPAMPESLSAKAKASLEKLGVEVIVGAKVEDMDGRSVRIGNRRIEAGTTLWAAGVIASPAGRWINAERDPAGRIVVAPDLSVPGHDGIYAIGDTAACPGPGGRSLPGLAPVAKQQGAYVAKLLRARIEGRPLPPPFRYRDFGSMATIGRKAAVADLPGIRLSGSVAWWLWGLVHVALLVDVRSRVAVLLDWFWSYLTFGRSMRLITGSETAPD